jgi:hypothetical protein
LDSNQLIKVKCLKCGNEEYKEIQSCACEEHCNCERPKCSECRQSVVPEEIWRNEIMCLIEGHLAGLYQVDGNFKIVECCENKEINKAISYLQLLKDNLFLNLNQA